MFLHVLQEKDVRDYCQRMLDSLESWLRRLIDDELSKNYGQHYLNYQDSAGNNLISKKLQQSMSARYGAANNGRYKRFIDAALLEEEISIICNPSLYKHFKNALAEAFPVGLEQARSVLSRLIESRNRLSHSNPISIRDAERVICYTGDVIDSLKLHYEKMNMKLRYNAPRFIRVTDSFGNVEFLSDEPHNVDIVDFRKQHPLHIGDTLSIQLEVDPAFSEEGYTINWQPPTGAVCEGTRFLLNIENQHVTADLRFFCQLISNKDWHRYSGYDHYLCFLYVVLPPE